MGPQRGMYNPTNSWVLFRNNVHSKQVTLKLRKSWENFTGISVFVNLSMTLSSSDLSKYCDFHQFFAIVLVFRCVETFYLFSQSHSRRKGAISSTLPSLLIRGNYQIFILFPPPQYIYSASNLCLSSRGIHAHPPREVSGKSSRKSVEPQNYFWNTKCQKKVTKWRSNK